MSEAEKSSTDSKETSSKTRISSTENQKRSVNKIRDDEKPSPVKLTFGVDSIINTKENTNSATRLSAIGASPADERPTPASPPLREPNPFSMDCILNLPSPSKSREISPGIEREHPPISLPYRWAADCMTSMAWPLKPGHFPPSKYLHFYYYYLCTIFSFLKFCSVHCPNQMC